MSEVRRKVGGKEGELEETNEIRKIREDVKVKR